MALTNDHTGEDSPVHLRVIFAQLPSTHPRDLVTLARDANSHVRTCLAMNPSAPQQALEILTQDPDVRVRRALAGASHTPEFALRVLAKDTDQEVLARVRACFRPTRAVLAELPFSMLYSDQRLALLSELSPELREVAAGLG